MAIYLPKKSVSRNGESIFISIMFIVFYFILFYFSFPPFFAFFPFFFFKSVLFKRRRITVGLASRPDNAELFQ